MELFMKTDLGEYIPIKFEKTVDKDWDNHLVVVRVGNDKYQATEQELDEIANVLREADVLDQLHNSTFMVVGVDVDFRKIMDLEYMKEVVGSTSFKEVLKG